METDKRKTVYDVLKQKTGYRDSYEDFNKIIDKDVDARNKVYNILKDKTGYKDSFDDFNKVMGAITSSPVDQNDTSPTAPVNPAVDNTHKPTSRFVQGKGKDATIFGVPYRIYKHLTPESQSFYYQQALDKEKQNVADAISNQAESVQKQAEEAYDTRANKINEENIKFKKEHPFLSFIKEMAQMGRPVPLEPTLEDTDKDLRTLQGVIESAQTAKQTISEAGKKGNTNFVSGLGRGMRDVAGRGSTWDMGVLDLNRNAALSSAANKYVNGQELNGTEKLLLRGAAIEQVAMNEFSGDLGRGYKMGSTTVQSLPFMAEFLINPLSGSGKAIGKGVMKQGLKAIGKELPAGMLGKVANGATRVLGDVSAATGMALTTGAVHTTADFVDRKNGNIDYLVDEDGQVKYDGHTGGVGTGEAAYKAIASSVIENLSEMSGRYFDVLGKGVNNLMGKAVEKSALVKRLGNAVNTSKVAELYRNVSSSELAKTVTDFERKTGFHGTIEEYGEEVVGTVLNAIFTGDQSFSDLSDVDQQIDTFLGVSGIGGLFSVVRTVGYRAPLHRVNREIGKLNKKLSVSMGIDWSSVSDALQSAEVEDRKKYLGNILQGEGITDEVKRELFEYVGALTRRDAIRSGKVKQVSEGEDSAENVIVDDEVEEHYENGYNIISPNEKNNAKIALEETIKAIANRYPDMTEDDVVSTINSYGETPSEILMYLHDEKSAFSPEYVSQVTDYLNAKAQYDGVIDNVRDGMEIEIDTQMDYITKNTHLDGNLYNATMKVDDRRVYVTGGNVIVGEDGMIDHQKSDKSIVVRDAKTGRIEMVDVRDMQSVQPGTNAEQHKAQIAEQIKQDYAEKAAADINGILPFNAGDTYTILNPETGTREEVVVQQVEGELVAITGKDGKVTQTTKDEIQTLVERERLLSFNEQFQQNSPAVHTNKKVLDDGRVIFETSSNDTEVAFDVLDQEGNIIDSDVMPKEEFDKLHDFEQESEVELGDDGLPVVDEEVGSSSEELPVLPDEQSTNENGTAGESIQLPGDLSQDTGKLPVQENTVYDSQVQGAVEEPVIPVDEEGNPQYYKVPVEVTIEDLTSPVDMDGEIYEPTDEEIDGLVLANKEEASKRLEKLSGKPPKIGANKSKYFAAKKQWTAQVADAQAQVDYWNEVEAQMKLLRQKPGDTTAEDIKAMGEPMNGEELAAMMLGAGKLPLLHSEYKRETGFGNADAKQMFGLFTSKEKGGMTIEQAGEQLMLADLEAGTNFFDQNDPNAGRNAIIDVLSSARTRGGLIDYIKNNREAMAERERQAEIEADELAKEQWLQDITHMTSEERDLWKQGELLTESNVVPNDGIIEFYNTFVDDILNEEAYDSRRERTDDHRIEEGQSNELGGIYGSREGGYEVLQGEEIVSPGRVEGYQGEPGEVAARSNEGLYPEDDSLQDSSSPRELTSVSESQEKVSGISIPSRMEGESILDYASRVNDAHVLHKEEQKVNIRPTDAQKEAGNYRKGHIKVDGFDITIENPKGSERSGVDADGNPWSVTMNNTYGYIRGTEGADGDHIDMFLGNSGNGVYVVDQVKNDGSFDEHKVMYGFGSVDEAREAYLSNYSAGWKGLGNITGVSKETFKKWVASSHRKTKPFAEYKLVQERAEGKRDDSVREEDGSDVRFREGKAESEEQSIIDRAKADGTYRKAPNGKPSNLGESQWVQVRTQAFKKWFGDWEKAARIEKLRKNNPVEITGEEYKGQYELNRESAQKYILNNLRGEYTINDTGERVKISKKGAKKVTSHSQGSEAHMQSIVAIPEMIGNSIFIEERPAYKDNAQYDSYRYYVTGLKIGGEDYTARITIGVKNGEFYYDHYLTDIEKGNLIEVAQSFKPTEDAPNPSYANDKDSVLLSILQTNSSKVVDENGEPLIVFHGTPLRRDQITPNRGWQKDGFTYISQEAPFYTFRGGEYSGMIFTSVDAAKARSIAEKRAMSILDDENGKEQWTEEGYVYDLFANIRKPFVSSSDYGSVLALFGDRIPTLSFIGGKGEMVSLDVAKSILKSGNSWLVTETPQFVEKIKELGYDGLIGTDEGIKYIACFTPNQLKDAYDNIGEFSSENDDIRFREVKEKDGSKSLVGLHNISEDKLLKALKLGGFANPSAAVIDIDRQTHEGYGEISLVLPSAMIEKRTGRNAGTWSADAWTPTYPSVERKLRDNGSELFAKDLEAIPEEMRLPVKRDFQNYMYGRDSDGLTYMFLHEKGVEPSIETVKSTYSDEIHKEIKEVTNNGTLSLFDLNKDGVEKIRNIYINEKFGGDHSAFEESMKGLRDRWSSYLKEGNPNSFRYEKAKQNLELMDEFGFDFSNVQSLIGSVESDIKNSGKVDVGATIKNARKYVDENGLKGEFANWMESLNDRYGIEEVIFDGFTPSGKRRYIPNTLENVSKMMKKEGRNGATGIGVTFQNFAAGLLKAKANLKDIRAEKNKLTSEYADVDEFRDKWSKVMYDLGKKLQPDAESYDDYGLYRLAEAAQSNNPQKYIKKEYGIDLSDEDVKQLDEMIEAIRNEYPAMYFETKFERPVYLNEFAAAVVPDNMDKKIMDAMSEAGLQVVSYKAGDETARGEAVKKASEVKGIRFRFIGEKGAENMDKAEESTIRLDNLSVAREMESSGKDAKTIKVATGWERGADGKWRYETEDFDIDIRGNAKQPSMEWMRELDRLSDKIFEGTPLTSDEDQRFEELVERKGEYDKQRDERKRDICFLDDYVIDKGGLFKAYPQLKEIEVVFENNPSSNKTGSYSDSTKTIKINMAGVESVRNILIHEVQHAIQYIEGFEHGGNPTNAEKQYRLESLQGLAPEWAAKDMQKYSMDYYNRISGEVEARNVSKRADMTLEERRNSLAMETEDVAREDQIFLENALDDRNYSIRQVKTYHGSGAEFDKFNLDHIGEGEGERMLGKGVYTTKSKRIAKNYADVARNKDKDGKKHLYEVNIPKDNGHNYLDYDKMYTAKEMERLIEQLHAVGIGVGNIFTRYFQGRKASGMNLYRALSMNMPEGTDVNEALSKAGYVGFKYSTRHDWGGKHKLFSKKSYVVFNPDNANIVSHKQIKSEVESISEKLHTPVRIINSIDELSDGVAKEAIGKGRKIKGWYDIGAGEVVLYLPNTASIDDGLKTVLHETVGHKGLRQLFGEENYDAEMMKLFGQLPEDVRRNVADVAVSNYNSDVSIAMDEYLAEQAEKNETPSWWDKVVSAIRNLLRKAGLKVSLSENDVKYLLWRSRKNLERTPLDLAADIDMRNRLEIGEYNEKGKRFRDDTNPEEEDLFGEQFDGSKGQKPSLLEAYKNRIFELSSRISSLERKIDTYESAEELANEVIEEIKKEIGSDIISEIGKKELNSLLLQVKNAKTKKSLEKIFMNVKKVALTAQSRKLQRMMDKLLALKVQDVNGKNMSIAKNVDDSTRRIFSFIRGKLSDIKKSGLEDDILYLKRENKKAQEEIKRLERTVQDTDDLAMKDEAMSSIEKHKKAIEENKVRIQELRDEKSELEKQIAGAVDIDVEKEMAALNEKLDKAAQGEVIWTQGDNERMAALNIISGQIMNKSHDFEIQSIELDIQKRLMNNSNLYKDRMKEPSENKRRIITNAIKENRRQVVALERLINDTRAMQIKQLQMTIEQLEELISNGKNSLLRQTEEEIKRKSHIIGEAIQTVEGKPINLYDKESTEEGKLKKFFSAPLGSFEYMCKRVNTKTLGKDGFLYKYFVEGKDGVMEAYNTYVLGMEEFRKRLDEKSKKIFGKEYEKVWSQSDKVVNESGVHVVDTGQEQRIPGKNNGYGVRYEIPLSKGQAMYIYQVWKMNDGRTKLELQGFDEESIAEIRDFIGDDYIKFADWVQEELLPDLRERYNEKYLEMYGTSLAEIKDYVPLRIAKKSVRQESDLSEDKEQKKTLEERAGSLIKRVVNIRPVDITMSAFDVLFDHGRQMEEWNAYARVRRDLDAVLSNTTFRNQLDANTRGSFRNFYDAAAVATKTYHPDQNRFMDEVIGKLSKGIVGGNIAWRFSTALKQILSAPAFWGYSQSPRYMKSLLSNTVKMPVTFKWCMENIPSFKERVTTGAAGNEKLEEKSISKYLDKYIETGMIPNKLVDAITCSIGAKSIFDYRYGQLIRQGVKEGEARNQALMDADIYYNQTQQSSHPAFLSPMQMSRSLMDRMLTTYQNSNIGYVRKVLAAYYDLTRSLKWKELQKNYTDMYMKEGMGKDEAERKAYRRLLNENKKTAFEAILFAWGMNLLWNIGSQGLLGFFAGDGDDDNAVSKGISFFLTSPIKGMPGGNLLESIASGYGMNPVLVYDELDKFMKEVKFTIDEYGLISPEIAYTTLEKVSRYGGVDLEVLGNIYLGVEGIARDGALDDDKMIDFMYMLNSPKSNRAAVAKELYKDESIESFAEKVARAYKYIPKRDPWEGWVPGAKELNKRRKRDIEKEYKRLHMTEEEKKTDDEKKVADKHRRKLKELEDDPFALADYIDNHQEEHKLYQKYY